MQLSNRAFKNYFATLSTVAIPSEEDAHAAAISEVRSLFNNSSQIFGRLSASRAEFEKMKAQVDIQLSNLVNTQIEESRYALELLTASTKDIATTRNTFTEIDKACQHIQSLISNYEPIKKVAVARKNLAATIGLLQLFRSIPTKAQELQELITDDRQLKNVYKEIKRLISAIL